MNYAVKFLIGISALAGLWALNLAYEVFPRISAAQEQAIATLSTPALSGQRNGWNAALEMAARPEFATRMSGGCSAKDDCFALASADLPAMQQRVRDAAPMIALQKTLYSYDYWAMSDADDLLKAQFPAFQLNELLTTIATQAASGETATAARELCEFSRFSRSLTRTNSLILMMVGDAYLTRSMRMMTELQNRYAITPDTECMQAFAPLSEIDSQFCEAIKGEFMFNRQVIQDLESGHGANYPGNSSGKGSWLSRLGFNSKHSQALIAGSLMRYCPQVQQQKAAQQCSWTENVLNPIGCELFQIGQADYASFQNRLTDLQQKLALFRLSQFARSTQAQACIERLDCGPEGALAGLIHDTAKGTISVTLMQPRTDQPKEWTLALL